MAYRNNSQFIGNIGKDGVSVKEGPNGKFGRASLAVTERWKKEDGEKAEKTTWIQLLFPSHLVENAAKYVAEGRQVFVEGKIELNEYTVEGGEKRANLQLRVDDYQLLGAKPDEKAA